MSPPHYPIPQVKHGANFETAVVAVADQRLQVAIWTQAHGTQAVVEKAWQQEHHAELVGGLSRRLNEAFINESFRAATNVRISFQVLFNFS